MSEKINLAIKQLQRVMDGRGVELIKGLPKELLHLATTLIPCANIDLLITRSNKLIFTWSDDEFYGQAWHIPGGCLRMRETLDNQLHETARNEIGTEIIYDPDRFITISMLFDCHLPDGFEVKNEDVDEYTTDYIKWFDQTPPDLLETHKILMW